MLIDGKLVEAKSGKPFDNVNPATEEVLGPGGRRRPRGHGPGHRRRPPGLRRDRLVHRQGAAQAVPRASSRRPSRRSGSCCGPSWWPRWARRCCSPTGPSSTRPLAEGLTWPASFIDEFAVGARPARGHGLRHAELAQGGQGAGRGGRPPSSPGTIPFEVTINKLGQALATGNTVILKAGPEHPVERHPDRPPGGRADRLPRRRAPGGDHRPTTRWPRSWSPTPGWTSSPSPGRPRSGRRIMEKGAPTLKRLFLELGGKSADIVLDDADFEAKLAIGVDGVHPRRPGMRDAHPDAAAPVPLRRGHRPHRGGLPERPLRRPDRPGQPPGAPDQRPPAGAGPGLHREGQWPRAPAWWPAADGPPSFDKGYYVEPTLFADVDNSMTIAQEEIFGPVLVVIPFEDDDDAVRHRQRQPVRARASG